MVCMNTVLWSETFHSFGNTLTLVLIVLVWQIAYKELRDSYIGQNYETLAYHNCYKSSVKEVISFCFFLAFFKVYASQESCVGTGIWTH